MNKETLEEAIGNYIYSNYDNQPLWEIIENAVKFGAKWQKKRMYSEENVMNALHSVELKYNRDFSKIYEGMKEWFEQFKKK